MSEIRHTPGPWRPHVSRGLHFIQSADGVAISVCHDAALGNGNDEANATLIAAAPELLEANDGAVVALEEAAKLLRSRGLGGCAGIMEKHAAKCRAALAKARGES